MSIDDNGLVSCPEGVPVWGWARGQAMSAAVFGAPGWFSVGEAGAVNVRQAPAVFACEDPDGDGHRILVLGAGDSAMSGWSINAGPFADSYEAARVAQAVLVLAHDPGWPPARPWDAPDETDERGDPVLFDIS